MNERRDHDFGAHEEALDLLGGAGAGPSAEREAERLEPTVAMLRKIPREAWKAPLPPELDLAAVTGANRKAGSKTEKEARRRTGFAELLVGGWPRLVAGAAAAVALLAIGVVFGVVLGGDRSGDAFAPSERLVLSGVTPEAPDGASGEVLVAASGSEPLELDVSGLKPTGEGEYYEFWLLGAEGELVSLGSFRVDEAGESKVKLPLPVDPADYGYFDLSIEKEDGSPGHSGKSVLRGLTKA